MTLLDWIDGTAIPTLATATPATVATESTSEPRSVAEVATVAVAKPQNPQVNGVDRTEGLAAVALLRRVGARILPHQLKTIAVPRLSDTPEVRQALALLGYGAYEVAHLDREYRGESIDVVEAALRAAGDLPC